MENIKMSFHVFFAPFLFKFEKLLTNSLHYNSGFVYLHT